MSLEFEEGPQDIELPASDNEIIQRIEGAKKAILNLDEGINVRKKMIEGYRESLSKEDDTAMVEADYVKLSPEQKLRYLDLIANQDDVITQYEQTRTHLLQIVDQLRTNISGPEVVYSLKELEKRYGSEYIDQKQGSFEINVDQDGNEII